MMLSHAPSLVFSYNNEDEFKVDILKLGAMSFITPFTSDSELQALLVSAFNYASILEKNKYYRDILVKKNLILSSNEVMTDYNDVIENTLEKIKSFSSSSVLVAISPNDKTKFLLKPNQIETIILNNIRKNDILMNYAVNKYFLLLNDVNIDTAKKIWAKIESKIPEKVYAGFANTFSKSRQQLVNEVLNRLHEAINSEKIIKNNEKSSIENVNFKLFKQEFNKNFEQIVIPAFYHIKQKYGEKFLGITIEQAFKNGCGEIFINSAHVKATFRISCPGFSKINIDILYKSLHKEIDSKRISVNPDEFEAGFLEDLLEQFIMEFRKEINDGCSKL